jgi:sugar porter (SP) family MFS transporter
MIPAIILFFGMIFLPESPRWLARKDRWNDCLDVLALVHGHGDKDHPFVLREYADIKDMCEFERNNADVTYLELFKPNMINRTHIGIFTQIWSQLTGMNVMMYYITYVFAMAGLTGNNLLVSSSIQYVINVVMTVPALLYVDRWGRRPTLLIGALLMMTWLFANAGILASYGHYAGPNGVDGTPEASWSVTGPPSKAIIACSYLFVASYAPTWGPVSWIYPPELYPLRVRGKAVALATSANWAFNFALGYFVPPAFVNIQWKVYILFGVFCLAMFFHVLFLFPETAGKTLEETEQLFTDPNGIKYLGTPAWKTHISTSRVEKMEHGQFDVENGNLKGRESKETATATDRSNSE